MIYLIDSKIFHAFLSNQHLPFVQVAFKGDGQPCRYCALDVLVNAYNTYNLPILRVSSEGAAWYMGECYAAKPGDIIHRRSGLCIMAAAPEQYIAPSNSYATNSILYLPHLNLDGLMFLTPFEVVAAAAKIQRAEKRPCDPLPAGFSLLQPEDDQIPRGLTWMEETSTGCESFTVDDSEMFLTQESIMGNADDGRECLLCMVGRREFRWKACMHRGEGIALICEHCRKGILRHERVMQQKQEHSPVVSRCVYCRTPSLIVKCRWVEPID